MASNEMLVKIGIDLDPETDLEKVLQTTLLRVLLQKRAMECNLEAAQARGTELLLENRELKKRVAALEEALVWCSGFSDFSPEGIARVGFEKLVVPLLSTIKASSTS